MDWMVDKLPEFLFKSKNTGSYGDFQDFITRPNDAGRDMAIGNQRRVIRR